MRLWPRTLFGQTALALCAGLIALQVLGAWLTIDDRARFTQRMRGERAAERIAGIATVLDAAEPATRPRVARALDIMPVRIQLDRPWATSAGSSSSESAAFASAVRRRLDRPLQIQLVPDDLLPWPAPARNEGRGDTPGGNAAGMQAASSADALGGFGEPSGPPPGRWVVQARLADGSVATIHHVQPRPVTPWPGRLLGWLIGMSAAVAALVAWSVRRSTRPLAVLATAASELPDNLERPPIAEHGPLEVRRAARAFNTMQANLRRMIDTRAHTLAAVSHDLRLPLTRVRLRLEHSRDPELHSAIESDLAEMDAMIDNALAFLRAGKSDERAALVNLDALIDGVIEDAEAVGMTVTRSGEAHRPVSIQPQAVRRCLGNLIANAHRYGGHAVDIEIREGHDTVCVAVGDHGPGIPEADLERVFEPYVRLEASRARDAGGSGLGLAIARATARAQGGDVRLSNRRGGGLLAELILPLPGSPARA